VEERDYFTCLPLWLRYRLVAFSESLKYGGNFSPEAKAKGCFACHDVNAKKVGPAFKDVAKKYAGKPDAVAHLSERIKKGGVGEWGNVPMPPQNVTDEEAKKLAEWVLSLK
jgi:cytochrome c551/c552